MDYYNDAGFRQYYESMMQESPSSRSSAASRGDYFYEYGNDREEAAASRGDYFYGAEPQDVSYEEEEVGIPAGYGYDASVVPAAANAAAVQVMGGGKERKKKKKQKRDPNKPKGWLTAVLTYSNAHRKRAKSENPNASFGDIARLLSAEYKNLSPDDQARWQKASVEDKARYDNEMESYVPSEGYSEDHNASKKSKKKKDPNAPKNKRSAWQFFSIEQRKALQAQYPDSRDKEIMKMLGKQWKSSTAEQRAPFVEMASQDKARYEREMTIYNEYGRTTLPEGWQG